jgi:hypothetical protein
MVSSLESDVLDGGRRRGGLPVRPLGAADAGLIPLVAPTFFRNLPHALHPLLESGILLASIVAVITRTRPLP